VVLIQLPSSTTTQ